MSITGTPTQTRLDFRKAEEKEEEAEGVDGKVEDDDGGGEAVAAATVVVVCCPASSPGKWSSGMVVEAMSASVMVASSHAPSRLSRNMTLRVLGSEREVENESEGGNEE